MRFKFLTALVFALSLAACATVDVTKTAKGHYDATNPNDVEILKTRPNRSYVELGTITAANFPLTGTATMHNEIRAKAAALGANAAVLTEEGVMPGPYKWATGVAIRFTDSK